MKRPSLINSQDNDIATVSEPAPGFGPPGTRNLVVGLTVLLVAATAAVYYPVAHFPFISLNDGQYVIDNFHIRELNWHALKWSFTTFYAANWHPLTWISHAVDYRLFGLDPGWHHASNLLLHTLNVMLLFYVLWRATSRVGPSFMVAALFALHPINVESVAWIAERKNLLSMFFCLLTLAAYRWYASNPRVRRYVVVAILLALGLMAKPQVVTLPFVLLLWDYWPLERMFATGERSSAEAAPIPPRSFSWLAAEKLPLLAMCAAVSFLTFKAQQAGGAMGGALRTYSLTLRLENAIVSYARYMSRAVWPTHLAFFYPHPRAFYRPQVVEVTVLLVLITVFAVVSRRRYLAVGWLWFLGTLIPMIGVVQVGGQAMADRYAYLPFVGLFVAACWRVADAAEEWRVPKTLLAAGSVAILLALSFLTHRQVSYWASDVALWSHTVEVTKNNPAAENVLAESLEKEGRLQEAMPHFRAAARLDPYLAAPHYHLGIYEAQQGDWRAAIDEFKKVIAVTEGDRGLLAALRADAFVRMSSAYSMVGEAAAAQECLKRADEEEQKQQIFDNGKVPGKE